MLCLEHKNHDGLVRKHSSQPNLPHMLSLRLDGLQVDRIQSEPFTLQPLVVEAQVAVPLCLGIVVELCAVLDRILERQLHFEQRGSLSQIDSLSILNPNSDRMT